MTAGLADKRRFKNEAQDMDDFQRIYGPWALVTGASSGIGRAVSHELAARKLNLVVVSRRQRLLDTLKKELEHRYGIEVRTLGIDLTKPGAIEEIDRSTQDIIIGLVVPAAGVAEAAEFTGTTLARHTGMAHLNMIVPMQLIHVFANKMAKRKRGGVLLVSSLFGYQGIPYVANYAATKAYVLTLGEALHFELKKHGIDVSVLAPGLTDTDMPANLPLNFSKLPMFYQSPWKVARTGIRALGKKATVVSGLINKFYAWQNRLVPRSLPVSLFGFLIKRSFKTPAALRGGNT